MDWNPATTPNFSPFELACKCGECGGKVLMDQEFMKKLQKIRDVVGPMVITSGYRCEQHPAEKSKVKPGWHNKGRAVDVAMVGGKRMMLLRVAMMNGMRGFGFGQTFQHLDDRENLNSWTY